MSGLNIFLAVLVFSIIILFHEFGHFIVAKINKIKVVEFSLGMGPRLISWEKTKERRKVVFLKSGKYFEEHPEFEENTLYSLKLLPFGGSCMMVGEEEAVQSEDSFSSKSVYARMAVIFAGPFFNFILAFLFSFFVILFIGYSKPAVTMVQQDGPAQQAGLRVGDVIREINGEKITIDGDFGSYLIFNPFSENEEITIVAERDGADKTFKMKPQWMTMKNGKKELKIGINHGIREKTGIGGMLKYSAYEMKYYVVTTVKSLAGLITRKVNAGDVAGPVGIVTSMGDSISDNQKAAIKSQEQGNKEAPGVAGITILSMMNWCILLSANLGVMNLLPIPALDGGRLLFLIIEWIRRKPLNPKYENAVNVTGFMLLMLLMVVILGHDLIKIFF